MVPPALDPVDLAAAVRAAWRRAPMEAVLEEVRDRLAERYDARAVTLTGSGTEALTLALRIAARDRGSKRIALPAWGCYALATAAVGAGAEALFYDLDPRTLAPEPDSLSAALERGARTVVVAHYFGYPGLTREILHRIEGAGALLVEDAAQGAGGSYDGRVLGSFGTLSVLSFGRGKGMTCGGGGALLQRGRAASDRRVSDALAGGDLASEGDRSKGWRELLLLAAQWMFGRPELYRIPASLPFLGLGETTYAPPADPRPIPEAVARILRVSLAKLDGRGDGADRREREARERRRAARLLEVRLGPAAGGSLIRPVERGVPGQLRLPILLAAGNRGSPSRGIVPGYPRLLPELGVVSVPECVGGAIPTPGAAHLKVRLHTLPTHARVSERDRASVARWVQRRVEDVSSITEHEPSMSQETTAR